MAMTIPFTHNMYRTQTLNDDGIRWSGPNSNILVMQNEVTRRKLKLLDPQGKLIKEYKRGRRIVNANITRG